MKTLQCNYEIYGCSIENISLDERTTFIGIPDEKDICGMNVSDICIFILVCILEKYVDYFEFIL